MHLMVYFDGARLKCATGEKCKPTDWNADRQKFRASYPLPEEANQLLPMHPNQVMNKYLKRVAKLAGLTGAADLVSTESGGIVRAAVPKCELVTMHTARHTFATQSLLCGMPVEVLQKVLGHKKVQTTLIHAKIIEDFQHQTMRRIWDGQSAGTDSAGARSNRICAVEPAVA